MADALYGPAGFYVDGDGPQRHFRTSATASPLLGRAIHRLAARVDAALGHPPRFDVVDVGAGDGSLLLGVAASLTDSERGRWVLHGVDLRGRPTGLLESVGWSDEPPEEVCGLLVAHELLDNVPVDVVELTPSGPRLVLVDDAGEERLGDAPAAADLRWLDRWWPLDAAVRSDRAEVGDRGVAGNRAEVGDRAEVGRTRDAVWATLVGSVEKGLALAVDYAHTRQERAAGRYPAGTLTGYRDGRQVLPIPDGTCDVTAHVALDACEEAGRAVGVEGSVLLDQRTALAQLGVTGALPPTSLAHEDPAAYVRALSEASEAAELRQPGGLGDFGWLLQSRATPTPLPVWTQGSPHSAL